MTPGELAARLARLPPPERRAGLAAAVLAEIKTALLMSAEDDLPLDANYIELGLSSLKVVAVKEELETRLDVEIDVSVLFGQPTVEQLLAYLAEALPDLLPPTPVPGPAGGEAAADRPDGPGLFEGAPDLVPAAPAEQRRLLDELLLERYEPVAVVGIGLRFPGGNDTPDQFARFLAEGRSGTGPIPADRWDADAFASTVRTAGGGFLTGIDRFDAKFFAISPKEARYVDPQQRILLETAWAALEHANIDPTRLRHGSGGVYIGVSNGDYNIELDALAPDELDGHLGTGTAHSAVAGRLSYFLGWRGPCLSVDTACSSSLVALHLAVTGLRRRECEIALVGGVNIIHHPRNHIICSRATMLAADGRCKTFDDTADGYGRSEGCGVIVLMRLSDARRSGRRILGLVRGTAVRQDGASGGLTVPNGAAQEEVMRAALTSAGLAARDVQYVEAHGTGTSLGDPIEMSSIRAVLAGDRPAGPVLVGSVKTNIGHMEPAAGIGGVIKSLLQLRQAEVFPHLNLTTPSRHIPWDDRQLLVPTGRRAWPAAATRRALVNAFGFAGTIATAVLEQPPEPAGPAELAELAGAGGAAGAGGPERADGPHVFTLSAVNPAALRGQVATYRRHLTDHPDQDVADVCYTANVGRAHFSTRLAGVVGDRGGLERLLDADLARLDAHDGAGGPPAPAVALLFSGQGAQYPGMGRPLYRRFPVFRQHVDECDRLFADHIGLSIRDMILDGAAGTGGLGQTRYTQPALFTVEYALARLWQHWGVRPSVLLGHSIGEVTAAAVAGLFTLPDAVRLVSARARLMQSVSAPGGMCAVRAPAEDVAPLLAGVPDLAIAAVNAPRACVVSGGERSLARLRAALADRGVPSTPLAVSHAFHSPLMDEVSDAFRAVVASVEFRVPELTIVSNLTGAVADPADMSTPDYWVRHIGAPVNFLAGIRAVAERGRHAFVEVGPGGTLIGLGRQCVRAGDHRWLPSMRSGEQDTSVVQTALAELYAAGLPVSWVDYHDGLVRPTVTLPTYAFDRRRHWLPTPGRPGQAGRPVAAPVAAAVGAVRDAALHPLLGTETTTAEQRSAGGREFATTLGPTAPDYLADHAVLGQVVFPAAGYVEAVLALLDAVYGETGRPIRQLRIHEALLLPAGEPAEVRVRLHERPDGEATVQIASRPAGDAVPERLHVSAVIGAADGPGTAAAADAAAALRERAEQAEQAGAPAAVLTAAELYAGFAGRGLVYGPRFRRLTRVARYGTGGSDLAVGEQSGPCGGAVDVLPPSILDCALQTVGTVLDGTDTYLPVGIEQVQLLRKPRGERLRSLLSVTGRGERELTADLLLLDGDRPVVVLRGLALRRVSGPAAPARRLFHQPRWVPRPLAATAGSRARHVLVVGRPTATLAGLARAVADRGGRLSVAAGATGAAEVLPDRPTDVCWFWRPEPRHTGVARLRAETEANFRELLDLLGALDRAGFGGGQRLWLVSEGAHELPGDPAGTSGLGDPGGLAAATLWGFGLTAAREYPDYRIRLVDLPRGGDDTALLDEWSDPDADEDQLAYRDGVRYVRRIQPADVDQAEVDRADVDRADVDRADVDRAEVDRADVDRAEVDGAGAAAVRPDEQYLITGGLGALGLATAELLAGLGARHIGLVSRRTVPAGELAAVSARLPGVEVTVHTADIAEPADVERIAAALRRAPHPLGGVVHAAGTLADTPLAAMGWSHLDAVFRAKVYGTWLLHEALAGFDSLRFFVGFSSAASVLGPAGQANYAAGNAFLDAVLRRRAARGWPGLAVNWGPWAEVGMAARLGPQRIRAIEAGGMRFLPPATATRALVAALGHRAPQLIVGEFDWDRVLAGRPVATDLRRPEPADRAGPDTGVDVALLRTWSPPERKATVRDLVRTTVADLLGFDGIGEVAGDAAFLELGMDSLVGLELRHALERALGVSLRASAAFDFPTVAALTDFIDAQLVPADRR